MLVSGITSFSLVLVLLLHTDAKPTSSIRQKRAPPIGKRILQFPRMGGKRSSLEDSTAFNAEKVELNTEDFLPALKELVLKKSLSESNQRDYQKGMSLQKRKIQFPRLGKRSQPLLETELEKMSKRLSTMDTDQLDPIMKEQFLNMYLNLPNYDDSL